MGDEAMAAKRIALAPPGTSFQLGWVMAQLFDPRRFSRYMGDFNPSIQLPMISNLDPDRRILMAVAEVRELTSWFSPLRPAAEELRASVSMLRLGVEQEQASAGPSLLPADQPQAADQSQPTADARPYSALDFLQKVIFLHYAILEFYVEDSAALSAYHLGIKLSDLCWLPHLRAPGEYSGPDVSSTFSKGFERAAIAELQMLLRAATYKLPQLAAATVSKSLENWRDWADVNAGRLAKSPFLWPNVLATLRVQGEIWRQLLTVETIPEDEADQGSVLTSLRRIRTILVVAVVTAIALYLTIANFSGAAKVWTTIGTIAAALGVSGASLVSTAHKAADAFGWNQQTTARAQARVWSVTMLPAIPLSRVARYKLDRRGVHLSRLRANLDIG